MITGYLTNIGALDIVIILLGVGVAVVSIYGSWILGQTGIAERARDRAALKTRWTSLLRSLSVITDILPLLGLLGTALAILNTFLGLGGAIDSAEIVANFAPALTTTISGIFFAIVNTVIIQSVLTPAFEKRFGN